VTLEPCNHFGKTPPCTEAILEARIKRVVIAAADPTALAGGGARHLSDFGVEVEFAVEEPAALELNAPFFFAATNPARPWVTLKLALSSDDKMNDPAGIGAGSATSSHAGKYTGFARTLTPSPSG